MGCFNSSEVVNRSDKMTKYQKLKIRVAIINKRTVVQFLEKALQGLIWGLSNCKIKPIYCSFFVILRTV